MDWSLRVKMREPDSRNDIYIETFLVNGKQMRYSSFMQFDNLPEKDQYEAVFIYHRLSKKQRNGQCCFKKSRTALLKNSGFTRCM